MKDYGMKRTVYSHYYSTLISSSIFDLLYFDFLHYTYFYFTSLYFALLYLTLFLFNSPLLAPLLPSILTSALCRSGL